MAGYTMVTVLICMEMRLKWPMSANSASAPAAQ